MTGDPANFENYAEAFKRWFDVRAVRVGDPADRQIAILFNDVTKRREAEERLRASEAVARENVERVQLALAAPGKRPEPLRALLNSARARSPDAGRRAS